MANSHLRTRIYGLGDFEQTQNNIVLLIKILQTVVPPVKTRKESKISDEFLQCTV
jgi:hypothetical protein